MSEVRAQLPEEEPLVLLAMRGKIVAERLTEEMTGRLYLPVSARDRSTLARVVSVYEPFTEPGYENEIVPFLQEGDVVIFGANSGVELTLRQGGEQKTYIVLREAEVLCKVANYPGHVKPAEFPHG